MEKNIVRLYLRLAVDQSWEMFRNGANENGNIKISPGEHAKSDQQNKHTQIITFLFDFSFKLTDGLFGKPTR